MRFIEVTHAAVKVFPDLRDTFPRLGHKEREAAQKELETVAAEAKEVEANIGTAPPTAEMPSAMEALKGELQAALEHLKENKISDNKNSEK